jgi:hypothetical protein
MAVGEGQEAQHTHPKLCPDLVPRASCLVPHAWYLVWKLWEYSGLGSGEEGIWSPGQLLLVVVSWLPESSFCI